MTNSEFFVHDEEGHPVAVCLKESLGEGSFAKTYRAEIKGVTGTLRKIKRKNPKDLQAYKILRDLCLTNNFIKGFVPHFEFFVNEKNGDEYLFCSDVKLMTFEDLCSKICEKIRSRKDYEANYLNQ